MRVVSFGLRPNRCPLNGPTSRQHLAVRVGIHSQIMHPIGGFLVSACPAGCRHPRIRDTRPISNGYPKTSPRIPSVGQSVRGRSHEQ